MVITQRKWIQKNLDDLLGRYEFDLHEALNNFDEETAEQITTFHQFCEDMYKQYIDDEICDSEA